MTMKLILLLVIIVLIAVWIGLFMIFKVPKNLQHIPRVPLISALRDVILGTPYDEQVKKYAPLIQKHKVLLIFSTGQWMVITSCPDAIQKVFNNIDQFPRLTISEKLPHLLISKFMGHNIFTSNGSIYQRHRKVVGPAFRAPIEPKNMESTAHSLLDYIERQGLKNISALAAFQKATVDILGKAILGIDFRTFEPGPERFIEAYNDVIKGSFSPIFVIFPWLDAAWNPLRSHLHSQLNYLDEYFQVLYEQRMKEVRMGTQDRDILSLMIKASQDEHLNFTVDELKKNTMGLFTGGHDTTTSSLSLTLYMLATNEKHQIHARSEIQKFSQAEGGLANHLNQLTYLHACIFETLRLYPSVARQFPRIAQSATTFRDFPIPPETYVMIDTMSLHRDPDHHPHPEIFDPTRFLPNSPNRTTWTPFLGGPHHCIGLKFSLTQQKLILAHLLSKYHVHVTHQRPLQLGPTFLLSTPTLSFDFVPL